jgi:hypothetical protein
MRADDKHRSAAMPAKKTKHVPAMSDSAVKAKTGKDWNGWFTTLDKAGARKLQHKAIAALLQERQGISGWWSQMVTVEYERSRGLREMHQTSAGYSVSATKTIATTLAQLYEATADEAQRKAWFPKGTFVPSSQTKNKYVNGAWRKDARLNVGFYAKGEGRAQIAIQVNKLADKDDVERERDIWKAALAKLQTRLEDR